ncbi:non-ribosomal peptide synthetase [Xenorhabdus sp. PB62.4]|nr:non-ribosomal peptide synthetase [Xenorhabdus sp. PB62.4]
MHTDFLSPDSLRQLISDLFNQKNQKENGRKLAKNLSVL